MYICLYFRILILCQVKHSDNRYAKQFKCNISSVMQFCNHLSIVIHGVLTVLIEASVTVYPPIDLRRGDKKIGNDYIDPKDHVVFPLLDLRSTKGRKERIGYDYIAPQELVREETLNQKDVEMLVAEVYEDLQASDKVIKGIEVGEKIYILDHL